VPTYEKSHDTKSLYFDTGGITGFDTVAVAASQTNALIQSYFPVVQRMKIYKAVATFSAQGTGPSLFNIVVGTGVEVGTSAGGVDTIASAGYTVFNGDVTLGATANAPQIVTWLNPTPTFTSGGTTFPINQGPQPLGLAGGIALPDTIFDAGQLLTLRAVTPVGGSLTNFKVIFFYKPIDAGPEFSAVYPM
jgi:hypothetical protein